MAFEGFVHPDVVKQQHTVLNNTANDVQDVLHSVTSVAHTLSSPHAWSGSDANQFEQTITGEVKPLLTALQTAVTELVTTLQKNIAEQDATSSS